MTLRLTTSGRGSLIDIDLDGDVLVRHVLDNLPRRGLHAVVRSINRTATHVKTGAVREIAQRKRFKAAYLRERIEIRNARADRPEAFILARRRGTLLSRFPYRAMRAGKNRRGGGIQVAVKTGAPATVLRSAFLVRLRSGKEAGVGPMGIAVRNTVLARLGIKPESEGGSGSRRYSILHTSSVHDVYSDVLPQLALTATPFLHRQLMHELQYELNRLRRAS